MRVSWNGFQSNLAPQIEQYLRAKRAMGCKFASEDRQLRLLDRFLANAPTRAATTICLEMFEGCSSGLPASTYLDPHQ